MVGFVANPALPGASQASWWQQAYNLPDVALLHPARWDWSTSVQTVSLNSPTTAPPMEQNLYRMKGFSIPLDRKLPISVDLVAPRGDVAAHLVAFYDGVAGQGGKAFDFLRVARVSTGSPYRARTYFRPQTCGPRTLVVVAAPERTPAAVSEQLRVTVTVDPMQAQNQEDGGVVTCSAYAAR